MSSGLKCTNCESTDGVADSDIGETICTHCGSVLANNFVSEVEFEDGVPLGKFVWTDSTSIANCMLTRSSKNTLRKAHLGIVHLSNQLNLNSRCSEMALNFFKAALTKNLTRRRESAYTYAACVLISCRIEETGHLLNDVSDVLQISSFKLGKAYLQMSEALSINIPLTDPCIYVMRFANGMEFGDKTKRVAMTAQRIVQRMKKDHIHTGRNLSGYCGAALLMAARMHEFSRTPMDIVRIMKVHAATLQKRLSEFGNTPSSQLTLDEFMKIDLQREEDPPAFKKACKRNIERRLNLREKCVAFDELQKKISSCLEMEVNNCETIAQSTSSLLSLEKADTNLNNENLENELDGLDDDEINLYILSEEEVKRKEIVWNAFFGSDETIAEEAKLTEYNEEGEPNKKRRNRKNNVAVEHDPNNNLTVAKIQTNISSKINYDVLKTFKKSSIATEPKANTCTTCESSLPINETDIEDSSNVVSSPKTTVSEEDEIDRLYGTIEPEREDECLSLTNLLGCYDGEDSFAYNEYDD